jgi:hypothetical protein
VAAAIAQSRRGSYKPLAVACVIPLLFALPLGLALLGLPSVGRYSRVGSAVVAVVAGFGVGYAVRSAGLALQAGKASTSRLARVAPAVLGSALVALSAFSLMSGWTDVWERQQRYAAFDRQLDRAIASAGGPSRIKACLPIARNSKDDGIIAWKLGIGMSAFASRGALDDPKLARPFPRGTTFINGPRPDPTSSSVPVSNRAAPGSRVIGRDKRWVIRQRC